VELAVNTSFVPDANIQTLAEAYSLDCIDFARQHFGLKLDWSDDSIRHIETMLERFHAELRSAKPSSEQVFQFAKMFGSYVGEVFRRNHGANWGVITLDSDRFPGMKTARDGVEFWPWGRVKNRLINGPEDNVWHYYKVLVAEHGRSGGLVVL
jgi:hypothetical protein